MVKHGFSNYRCIIKLSLKALFSSSKHTPISDNLVLPTCLLSHCHTHTRCILSSSPKLQYMHVCEELYTELHTHTFTSLHFPILMSLISLSSCSFGYKQPFSTLLLYSLPFLLFTMLPYWNQQSFSPHSPHSSLLFLIKDHSPKYCIFSCSFLSIIVLIWSFLFIVDFRLLCFSCSSDYFKF